MPRAVILPLGGVPRAVMLPLRGDCAPGESEEAPAGSSHCPAVTHSRYRQKNVVKQHNQCSSLIRLAGWLMCIKNQLQLNSGS